jgi:glycosyltransferase involved in cell wall biosynthesis
MGPLVSILIPCYNARPWIAQCIQSAIDQTYPHKEIVVVDDGSTDGSLDVIRDFGDRVRFETGPNRGGNVARNRLIELSRGNWLSFLDADDYLLPEKIKRQMALIASNANIDVVYSPLIELIEKTGKMFQQSVEDDDLYANYIRWGPFSAIAPLWRKSAILEVGGWNPNQAVCQEHELLLRLIIAGKRFELLCEPLSVYRKVDGASISRRSPLRTLTQKKALTDKLETYLVASGKLKSKHRLALAQARFEDARTAYAYDEEFADNLIRQIYKTQDGFYPSGDAAPFLYRVAFKTFGFRTAENIAATVRKYRKGFLSKKETLRR